MTDEMMDLLEEIVIVGTRYGDLADSVGSLCQDKECIDQEKIRNMVGRVVYLSPDPNKYDPYAVGVYTEDQQRLGYVWMCQSHTLHQWMDKSERSYLKAYIKEVNTRAGVLTAEPESPVLMHYGGRSDNAIDMKWAENLPEVLTSITEQSLGLGLCLLRDELETATEWTDRLQMRIDNLLRYLPIDLSAHHYMETMQLYMMMKSSRIEKVKLQSDMVLQTMVWRGSKEQMRWWVESWLPDFFREAAEGDLLEIFETDLFTLERVEEILRTAPNHLFHLFKANRFRFANHLYYSSLPQGIYNRLLTLLAVREAMLNKQHRQMKHDDVADDEQVLAIRNAIETMRAEGELSHKYDYTWLMMVMNETEHLPSFDTPTSFVDYLTTCGLTRDIPNRTTVSRYYDKAHGQFPKWTFTDADQTETNRRINVAKRFLKLLSVHNAH